MTVTSHIHRLVLGLAIATAAAGGGLAQGLTCASLQDTPIAASGVVNVSLDAGDSITVTAGSGSTSIQFEGPTTASSCGFFLTTTSCAGSVFSAGETGTFTLEEVSGRVGGTLTCSEGAGGTTGGTTTTAIAGATAASGAAAATGGASTAAIGSAIAAGTSSSGGPVSGTRNSLRFSTAGLAPGGDRMWNAWAAVTGRRFDGTIDGDGIELTVGADMTVGAGVKAGLVLSYGDFDLTSAGTAIETEALSYGPYVSVDFGNRWSLDGFLVFAQPDYAIAGTRFSADRRAGGLNLNATYMLGSVEVTSFVAVQGFAEDHPAVAIGGAPVAARTISSLTGSIGSKATFNPGQAARPYISLAAEANRFDDGLGTETENVSPRLGAGIDVTGKRGDFHLHLEGGEIFDGTRDYSIGIGYNMRF
ncbi:MAG: hypothetical protein QNJ16_03435 [Rhodobacter sp.]|nr:hypothetical protein [Rhodobacter sp.]